MTSSNFKKGKRVKFLLFDQRPPKPMKGKIIGFTKRGQTALVKVIGVRDPFPIPRKLLINPHEK